ncbi:acetate--CoA ligase family protein [Nocardioides alkalitolerans]|uniref:acetate--CoA ligase family protein n=1 Tax=Nocardioides alkalitolerans TaxID=281714 RepID=UPI0004244453|nr:acetate--CoA ligase family protein [Nocardioides alkalitolerans]
MNHRLSGLLEPRSVALVGASDRSSWSTRINEALDVIGFDGQLFLVNPKGGTAHGTEVHRSVHDLPVVPDLAYVMVPSAAVLPAMRDVAAAGVKNAVVLSSGFAEMGEEGRAVQEELAELCRTHGMSVLGPNSLGYVNIAARTALKPFPPGEELRSGSVAIASQSGNVTIQLMNMARSFDVGLSFAVSTGNEMDVNLADVVDFLAQDAATSVIAVFAETFQDPSAFLAACRRARDADKLVVCLKVGRSEAAARAALAHTGSLVGNDAVIDAFLRAAGVVRVSSLEDLLVVADTFAHTGPVDGGLALLTLSGGTCDIVADLAEDLGLVLPDLTPGTVGELGALLPDFAVAHNPLDVTGAAVADAMLFGNALEVVARDPGIGIVVAAQEIDHQAENVAWGRDAVRHLSEVAAASGTPTILVNTTVRHLSPRVREIRRELGVPAVFGGVDRVLPAVHAIQGWTRDRHEVAPRHLPTLTLEAPPTGTWSEATCRPLLEQAGVPMVPGVVVPTAAEAARAAAGWDDPTAIKIVSDDILHKSDVGGVALGVASADVEERAARMLVDVRAALPDAAVQGLLVSPMRPDGVDLLVGVVREPGWGNVLAVGLGGIWAEVMQDVQRLALPAGPSEVEQALRRLRAWPLLEGARGTEPVDLGHLTDVIVRIADLSLALGEDLAAVEVNPLRVRGGVVEALDVAVVWSA